MVREHVTKAVLAIEREAAAPAATEALRAALSRVGTEATCLMTGNTGPRSPRVLHIGVRLAAALASPEPTPDSGLDVERLIAAEKNTEGPAFPMSEFLPRLAAEYARLASPEPDHE